jgi:hypothetical protein
MRNGRIAVSSVAAIGERPRFEGWLEITSSAADKRPGSTLKTLAAAEAAKKLRRVGDIADMINLLASSTHAATTSLLLAQGRGSARTSCRGRGPSSTLASKLSEVAGPGASARRVLIRSVETQVS